MIEKNQILMIIATNVRRLMNETGMLGSDLARRSHISAGSISKILKGAMGMTIPMAMNIAEGLNVGLEDLLVGLTRHTTQKEIKSEIKSEDSVRYSIGILSINNKRMTCIKNMTGEIIGTSEIAGSLDLADTSSYLLQLIHESIQQALYARKLNLSLKEAQLNLVVQSYEFEDKKNRFVYLIEKHFKEINLISDWQLIHLSHFRAHELGISFILDKGVSVSYRHENKLKKLGGWRFPVYDLGGERWLAIEAIRHTIEAVEGYVSMSELANQILAKCEGKLEKITELCFKRRDGEIYTPFIEILLHAYFTGDAAAEKILQRGFAAIERVLQKVDHIVGQQTNITLAGSLSAVYRPFFAPARLLPSVELRQQAEWLAGLQSEGIYADHI